MQMPNIGFTIELLKFIVAILIDAQTDPFWPVSLFMLTPECFS